MKKITFLLISFITIGFSSYCQPNNNDKGFEISKNLEIFSSAYKTLQMNYVDNINPGDLVKTGLDAMLESLDPYTNFIPESDIEDVKLQVLGQYGGVGALIQQKGNAIFVYEPYEDMPAQKAGLQAGDKFLEINGQSVEGKSTSDISNSLRGQAGTEVKLKMERNGKVYEKTLIREEIKIKPVPYFGIVGNNIGYIKLNEFTQNSGKEVQTAFEKLKEGNPSMKGIILDLRGNGGGLLNEAVNIVNIFVDRGQLVVSTKGKIAEKNSFHKTMNAPIDLNIPLVVLVDNNSASASEIVSGSLQDLDRGIILGRRTYGKGLVQNIFPLTYNAQMKVTIAKYYIPSGRCIQAIDYTHRDENGKPTKVPDSLKTAFKTKKGRIVYDGFGIEPDIETEQDTLNALEVSLIQKFLIFDYANQYFDKHPQIPAAKDFEITDELYADFTKFVKSQDYSYSTMTEKTLSILQTVAEDEKYYSAIQSDIENLKKKLEQDKNQDLEKFKPRVKELLKEEILSRYYYQKGRIEGTIKQDKDVLKAIDVISNKQEYDKILSLSPKNK